MNTPKTPLKKRKLNSTAAALLDLTNASQQQDDSQSLQPLKAGATKAEIKAIPDSEDDSFTENSADAQDDIEREESMMYMFREEARAWLMDHGKAFFHVEALAFLRDQQRKADAKSDPESGPVSKRGVHRGFSKL